MKAFRALSISALITSFLVTAQTVVDNQKAQDAEEKVVPLSIRDSDRAGALSYSNLRVHVLPRRKHETAAQRSPFDVTESVNSPFAADSAQATAEPEAVPDANPTVPHVPAPGF